MTLSELLESKFRGDIRFRGAAYIQAERVAVIRVTPDHLFAIVRDGVEYQTQLSRDNGILKLSCNCIGTDANKSGNPHCKHLWATIPPPTPVSTWATGEARTHPSLRCRRRTA